MFSEKINALKKRICIWIANRALRLANLNSPQDNNPFENVRFVVRKPKELRLGVYPPERFLTASEIEKLQH